MKRPKLMSVEEAAEWMGMSEASVVEMAANAILDAQKVGGKWILFADSVASRAKMAAPVDLPALIPTAEAARLLGITLGGVYHHIKSRRLITIDDPDGLRLLRTQVLELAANPPAKGNPSLLREPPVGFLTPPQVAKRLGVAGSLVHRYLNEGRIVGKKDEEGWLVAEAEVERFAATRKGRGRPRLVDGVSIKMLPGWAEESKASRSDAQPDPIDSETGTPAQFKHDDHRGNVGREWVRSRIPFSGQGEEEPAALPISDEEQQSRRRKIAVEIERRLAAYESTKEEDSPLPPSPAPQPPAPPAGKKRARKRG